MSTTSAFTGPSAERQAGNTPGGSAPRTPLEQLRESRRDTGGEDLTQRQSASPAPMVLKGRLPGPRPGRFDYDPHEYLSDPVGVTVTTEDVLSDEHAAELKRWFHDDAGVLTERGNLRGAYDFALFIDLALNGSSLQRPRRTQLLVAGCHPYPMERLLVHLGENLRRFARYYATEINNAIRLVLDKWDYVGSPMADVVAAVRRHAFDQGLQQLPHCIADVAEYDDTLSPDQRLAVTKAKKRTLDNTVNVGAHQYTQRAHTIDEAARFSNGSNF